MMDFRQPALLNTRSTIACFDVLELAVSFWPVSLGQIRLRGTRTVLPLAAGSDLALRRFGRLCCTWRWAVSPISSLILEREYLCCADSRIALNAQWTSAPTSVVAFLGDSACAISALSFASLSISESWKATKAVAAQSSKLLASSAALHSELRVRSQSRRAARLCQPVPIG